MNKIEQLNELLSLFGDANDQHSIHSDKIGAFVIVRCRDAGVHAGTLIRANGRSCSLKDARRLWYWKPANGAAFLSGVAVHGLDPSSKVGEPVDIDLTENCEIIRCSDAATVSIKGAASYVP